MRADDGLPRVEEPRTLIPNVGNGGHQCGSVNIIYVEEWWMQVLKLLHKVRERKKGTNVLFLLIKNWQ